MNRKVKRKVKEVLEDEINYATEVDGFLKDILTRKYILPKKYLEFSSGEFIILRKWNSYYPSFYNVIGGCYVLKYSNEYTIIDPGYRTVEALVENNVDTRLIKNIIITHNHPDHVAGLTQLLNLLHIQKSNNQEYNLYVNPGTLEEYKSLSQEGGSLKIEEIQCGETQQIFEEEIFGIQKVSFTAHVVPHDCFGEEAKSIGLIFEVEKDDEVLRFGITGDLDGDAKYMEYYKRIFNNLYFLVAHVGSLKFKTKEEKEQNKHLYPEGLYRLIDTLDDVKSFIIQEFGLEMTSPEKLSKLLVNILFSNGFYFPYLILFSHNIEKSRELQKHLIPQLLPKFLETFKLKKSPYSIIRKTIPYDLKRIIEFCYILSIDFKNPKSKNLEFPSFNLYNFWNDERINENEIVEINNILEEIWSYMRSYFFFGSLDTFDKQIIYDKVHEIDDYFNQYEFSSIIKKNIEVIKSLFLNQQENYILKLFRPLFESENFFSLKLILNSFSTNCLIE